MARLTTSSLAVFSTSSLAVFSIRRLALVFFLLAALVSGCPGPVPPATDAGSDDAPRTDAPVIECATAADCDDGLFCTGTEACTAGRCVATPVACDDGFPCTTDRCSEERLRCVNDPPDVDADGYGDAACLGTGGTPLGNDCDDDDAMRYPGNREICDLGHDEDCDATTLGAIDDDSDGFVSDTCCNGTACGDDCDDARDGTHPGATEVCDSLDQDCDDMVDDGVALPGFVDADRDTWGDSTRPLAACADSAGWVAMDRGGDCADDLAANPSARAINPGQPEICDGIRNDCDTALAADAGAGAVNWYADTDGDGFGSATGTVTVSCTVIPNASLLGTDCDDTIASVNPAAAEACNARDDDCTGTADFRIADNDFEDDDGDGLIDIQCTPLGTDCNDRDAASGPGELERCDGRDNDCDMTVDEGATSVVYYRDVDTDGYGSPASGSIVACMPSTGYVARAGDCNDADPDRFPSAVESCDAADEDCDAAIDEAPAASTSCSGLANTTIGTCSAGRCGVGECAIGFDDCNGRGTDGCEVGLDDDSRNCGSCGVACFSGETCAGGDCVCVPGSVRCPGGCIDPMRDERFCGAEATCSGPYVGTACLGSDLCVLGVCTLSTITMGPGAGTTGTRPRAVSYTIAASRPAMIQYTIDGSTPGSSATTMSAGAPVELTLGATATTERVRWRALYTSGDVEPIQQFTHVTDTASGPPVPPAPYSPHPVDNHGLLAEHVSINGMGSVVFVNPGTPLTVTLDIQYWHGNSNGYCPTCGVYTSVNFNTNVVGCLGGNVTNFPGVTSTAVMYSGFSAPGLPGAYPLTAYNALDFMCTGGYGEIIGWVVVDPTFPG